MPVRSLTQSVLRWPDPDRVLAKVLAWSQDISTSCSTLQRVGVFGSFGRGDAGVGSDLDLILVDAEAVGPQSKRLLPWPIEQLPLSADCLVLTPQELQTLLRSDQRMGQELRRDFRWLWSRDNATFLG